LPLNNRGKRNNNGRFAKGNTFGRGRPKGAKNKFILEITPVKELAAQFLPDPIYLSSLAIRLRTGEATHMEKFLAEHLWGKPRDILEAQKMILNFYKVLYADSQNSHGAGDRATTIDVTPAWHRPGDAGELPSPELPAEVPASDASGLPSRDARMAQKKW
jgi:hypothetical protein